MSDAVGDAVGGAVGGVVFLTSRRTPRDVVTFLQQQLARGEDSVVDDGGGVGSARGGEGRGEDNGGREGERHYWPPLSSFSPSFLWDPTLHGGDGRGGEGSNPYIPCLAAAAVIIVTPDSVSMASEACSTTAQVFVVEVDANAAAAGDDDGTDDEVAHTYLHVVRKRVGHAGGTLIKMFASESILEEHIFVGVGQRHPHLSDGYLSTGVNEDAPNARLGVAVLRPFTALVGIDADRKLAFFGEVPER